MDHFGSKKVTLHAFIIEKELATLFIIFIVAFVDFVAMENVFICVILLMLCNLTAESQWNSKDYLKREFSLVKPYSGSIKAVFVCHCPYACTAGRM